MPTSKRIVQEQTLRAQAMALPEPQMRIVLAYLVGVNRAAVESGLQFLADIGVAGEQAGATASVPEPVPAAPAAEPGITPCPPARHLTVLAPPAAADPPAGRWEVWAASSKTGTPAALIAAEQVLAVAAGAAFSYPGRVFVYNPIGHLADVWEDGQRLDTWDFTGPEFSRPASDGEPDWDPAGLPLTASAEALGGGR